ncbi:TPA: tape measure protein [Streptococcus suis]|nr:tape measure protein [Streptococcus suis]HEM2671305.1 tape measure protein [Streptococcus suis]
MADGKVTISVDLDGKQAQGGIEKLKGALGGLGSTFKSMLGANLLGSALTSGFNVILGTVRDMGAELNSSQKAWKTFEGNLQAFGRSAEEIKKAKTEMQDFATKTIYSASDMANTYSQLDAVGTKNVGSLVKAFGGLAASAENPAQAMKSLSTQATQMASKPKIAWTDFKIMMEQAPAGMAAVAKEMGMSTAELVSSVQDGKIKTEEFFDAMNRAGNSDAFQKMATEFKTIDQAIDGAKESLANKLMPAFEQFNQFGIKVVNGISDALEKLDFNGIATTLGKAFGKIESLFKSFFATVGDTGVFQNLGQTLSLLGELGNTVFSSLVGDASIFGDVAESVGDTFNFVLFVIQDAIAGVQEFIQGFSNTGAIKTVSDAFYEVVKAGLDLSEKLSGIIPWENIGAAAGHVVKFIAQIIQSVAKFSQSMSGDTWRGVVTGIGGALVAFKAFNFLKSFNPFSFFKKGAEEAIAGATGGVKRAKSTISQVFSGISNVINAAGNALKSTFQGMGKMFQGLGKTFEGVGKGIGAVLKGLMQGLRGLNPATLLSFGAAVGIAAVGIGAGIAIIAAGFALLASQGEGVAIIIEAVGTAFGTFASMVIGAFADAIVTVAGVLPTIAQSFNMMTPAIIAVGVAISMIIQAFSSLAPVITALGTAISEIVTAITTGVADIVTAVTPMVEILSSAFVQVVTVVSQAIVEIIQALAPFIPAVSEMVQAVAPVLQALVEAFNNLISQISPIIDSIANLFKTLGEQITSILDSVGGVVESFGSAIRNVLDGIAGIFDSIGNAALNAGKGFNQLAQGIERITKLNLLDMGASLAAVAAGLGAIGATSGGLISAGSSLSVIVQGLMTVQSVSAIASSSLASLGNVAVSAMSMLVAGVQLAVSGTKSGMTQIVNAISLSANQMIQAGKQAGDGTTKGVVTGIRSGIGQAGGAMHAMMIAIRDTGMQGVSSMRVVGSMISQGLAQGMMSSIGSVTAAANALVAQAERAAKAKAQIHSPSRLFRDAIGRFLPMGVAVGIEKNTKYVDKAMDGMYEHINAFNYKAEDVIGVGKFKLSKVVHSQVSATQIVENRFGEVIGEKVQNAISGILGDALALTEKAIDRPSNIYLDGKTLVGATVDNYTDAQLHNARVYNRMRGIL